VNARTAKKASIDFRRVDGALKRVDQYQGGSSLADRGFRRDAVIAFVDRHGFADDNQFYELVATNRGFLMKHFYDSDEAVAWLRGIDG